MWEGRRGGGKGQGEGGQAVRGGGGWERSRGEGDLGLLKPHHPVNTSVHITVAGQMLRICVASCNLIASDFQHFS